MAFEEDVLDVTFKAAGDLSAYQYHFVKLSADNTVDIASGATDEVIGVLQNKPSVAGQAARVRVYGVSRVVAAAQILFGAYVGTDGSGHAVTKTLITQEFMGICIEGAVAGTNTGSVLIQGVRYMNP